MMFKIIHRYLRRLILWAQTLSDEEEAERRIARARSRLSYESPPTTTYRALTRPERELTKKDTLEAARRWPPRPEVLRSHLDALDA